MGIMESKRVYGLYIDWALKLSLNTLCNNTWTFIEVCFLGGVLSDMGV